ncbi:MAG: phosphoribosylformylglycinamidine cyclo-ligase [Alphaproteobacteria bacterium]|nr:phosphoribosylformylglycinamidine cyclo-ligase [Alphaproteobacteria bacterium]
MIINHNYADAGVNIDRGEEFVEAIAPMAKQTSRPGGLASLGGFAAIIDPKAAGFLDPLLAITTDGVGTKLKLAIEMAVHNTIGIDLVAMCVNDLVVQGFRPLAFLDYYATGRLEVSVGKAIIEGIVAGCEQAGCALMGGETAEMPGLYRGDDYDLAGFALGAMERAELENCPPIEVGDLVLGLASSGVHSNGFSLVRRILATSGVKLSDPIPLGWSQTKTSFGEVLLEPTRIFVKPLLLARQSVPVSACAHITGGGLLGNIPRVLPEGLAVELDGAKWSALPIFGWLHGQGVALPEMARVFNCGIGMVVVIRPDHAAEAVRIFHNQALECWEIGKVIRKSETAEILAKRPTALHSEGAIIHNLGKALGV